MYKYLFVLSLIILSSCSKIVSTDSPTQSGATDVASGTTLSSSSGGDASVNLSNTDIPKEGSTVLVHYTLREGSPTSKVVETTKEDVAKASGLFASGVTYKPLEVQIGKQMVIPGFEKGIMGMKKGETKMIEVLPKDGYGELYITTPVPKSVIIPEQTVTADISAFQDKITNTMQRSMFGDQGSSLTVGQTLTGGSNRVATVKKIDGDNITIEIDNKDNPFYGKKIVPGLKASKDGLNFTIVGVTGTGVSVNIVNTMSPFAGKDFVVGATAPMPENPDGITGEVKILSMSGETVEIQMPNPRKHPFLGKTLYFELELVDILDKPLSTGPEIMMQNTTEITPNR